jgi:hypothetical protein
MMIHVGDPETDQIRSGFFGQIQILARAMAVCGLISNTRSQIRIQVIPNLPHLRTLILHLQMRYSTDSSFDTADFQIDKRVYEP